MVGARYCRNPSEDNGILFAPSLKNIRGRHVTTPLVSINIISTMSNSLIVPVFEIKRYMIVNSIAMSGFDSRRADLRALTQTTQSIIFGPA